MPSDLTGLIARLHAHIGCLERAAADPDAAPEVSSRISAMAHMARTAASVVSRIPAGDPTSIEEVPNGCS